MKLTLIITHSTLFEIGSKCILKICKFLCFTKCIYIYFIYILDTFSFEGSTSLNLKSFNELPVDLLFEKIVILCVIKNDDYLINLDEISNQRETIACEAKVICLKKSFDQRFIDHISPTYFSSKPVITKKKHYL